MRLTLLLIVIQIKISIQPFVYIFCRNTRYHFTADYLINCYTLFAFLKKSYNLNVNLKTLVTHLHCWATN